MKVEDEERVEHDQEKMTPVNQEEREQEPVDRPSSTREPAKDLERTPLSKADHSETTALFPENESKDFHKR